MKRYVHSTICAPPPVLGLPVAIAVSICLPSLNKPKPKHLHVLYYIEYIVG